MISVPKTKEDGLSFSEWLKMAGYTPDNLDSTSILFLALKQEYKDGKSARSAHRGPKGA